MSQWRDWMALHRSLLLIRVGERCGSHALVAHARPSVIQQVGRRSVSTLIPTLPIVITSRRGPIPVDRSKGTRQTALSTRLTRPSLAAACSPSQAQSRCASTFNREHTAFIAFGSNVGDRLSYIHRALSTLNSQSGVRVLRTSGLWETDPMYVTDQGTFLNGVCKIQTHKEPLALLDVLQSVEQALERRKTIDKGPRTIDLDILLYDNLRMDHERLVIPHKLMLERGFVLQPLREMGGGTRIPMYNGDQTTTNKALLKLDPETLVTSPMTPLGRDVPAIKGMSSTRRTRLMSIINVTPDSFSDGGPLFNVDEMALKDAVQSHIDAGADIIDVGGQSTRPNAAEVDLSEEIRRVIPAVELINGMIEQQGLGNKITISVDTYRASVARAAIEAGADIVNDVSAGQLDRAMLATIAQLDCPIVLMHMRGNPATMTNQENTAYPNGLIETIGSELFRRVKAASEAGIHRWRMILDPGIGFAKSEAQSLEILCRFGELRSRPGLGGIPWLVGTSRKGFIGRITGVQEPHERVWGTAAAVTAAVQGGADIVRVHDIPEMSQVVKMGDAIWRR